MIRIEAMFSPMCLGGTYIENGGVDREIKTLEHNIM